MQPGHRYEALDFVGQWRSVLECRMTIKFFALFFMQDCHMGPAEVSALGALGPIGISLASMLAQKAKKW